MAVIITLTQFLECRGKYDQRWP